MKRISFSKKHLISFLIFIFTVFIFSEISFSKSKTLDYEKIEIDCDEDLFVLGWSPKGHIAYMKYYDIGGLCGFCPTYEFIIQSLVTDKILLKKVYGEAMDYDAKSGTEDLYSINEIIEQNYGGIKEELDKYSIKGNTQNKIFGENLKFDNVLYSFKFDIKTKKEMYHEVDTPAKFKIDRIVYADLVMNFSNFDKKIIYKYRLGNSRKITDLQVEKCLQSPYEKRLAVIVVRTYPTVETGVRNSFIIVGAHLTAGF